MNEEYKNNTPIEILKFLNDIKQQHDGIKKEILDEIIIIEEKQKQIDFMLAKLENLEGKYVELMEVLTEKQNE